MESCGAAALGHIRGVLILVATAVTEVGAAGSRWSRPLGIGTLSFYITDSAGAAAAKPGYVGGKTAARPIFIPRFRRMPTRGLLGLITVLVPCVFIPVPRFRRRVPCLRDAACLYYRLCAAYRLCATALVPRASFILTYCWSTVLRRCGDKFIDG